LKKNRITKGNTINIRNNNRIFPEIFILNFFFKIPNRIKLCYDGLKKNKLKKLIGLLKSLEKMFMNPGDYFKTLDFKFYSVRRQIKKVVKISKNLN